MIYFQITGRAVFVRPIISPQATITSLNGIPVSQHFLLYDQTTTPNSEKTPVFLNFKAEVNITANLLTKFPLQKFVSNTYNRLENAKIKLNSKLTFERSLVNSCESRTLKLTSYMRRAGGALAHNSKQFTQSISVHGDVILPNTSGNMSKIYHFNDYANLSSILANIIQVTDRADIISEKEFKATVVAIANIQQNHLKLEKIDLESIFYNTLNADEHQIRSIIMEGDVHFTNNSVKSSFQNTFVQILNSIEVDNFFNLIVLQSHASTKKTIEISGSKTFISEMNISFSHMNEFNKQIQVRDWFSNSLRQQRAEKRMQQIIQSSGWQFINTISDNFEIKHGINGINFTVGRNESSNAIFNQFQTIVISSDVSFSNNVKITNKLRCNQSRPCKTDKLALNTLHMSQSTWDKLEIMGDVKLLMVEPNQQSSPDGIFDFLERALTSNTNSLIITDVIFKTNAGKIILNRVSKPSSNHLNAVLVNNMDFAKISKDAILLRNDQIKFVTFHSEKQLIAKETVSTGLENFAFVPTIKLINGVDLQRLNSMLFIGNLSELYILPWQRILFLNNIETQAVYVNESQTINGIIFEDIFSIYSESLSQRPTISFENLPDLNNQVPKLYAGVLIDVESINGFNWDFFIENRFKLNNQLQKVHELFDGYLTFENLILSGNKIKIDQINDVVYDDVVLKTSVENQQISGNKEMSTLQIKKPCHAWKINNIEFVSLYTKTVLLNHAQVIEKIVIRYPFHLKSKSMSVK